MNSRIFRRSFFEIDPTSVVASVGIVERFDDEEGGDHFCSGLGSRSGFAELEESSIPEGSVITPMSAVLTHSHVEAEKISKKRNNFFVDDDYDMQQMTNNCRLILLIDLVLLMVKYLW